MNRPTPTPPRRGPDKDPLLGGVGVGSESPCAREVRGGLCLRGAKFWPVLIRRCAHSCPVQAARLPASMSYDASC